MATKVNRKVAGGITVVVRNAKFIDVHYLTFTDYKTIPYCSIRHTLQHSSFPMYLMID